LQRKRIEEKALGEKMAKERTAGEKPPKRNLELPASKIKNGSKPHLSQGVQRYAGNTNTTIFDVF
jgi:hypothetical protein